MHLHLTQRFTFSALPRHDDMLCLNKVSVFLFYILQFFDLKRTLAFLKIKPFQRKLRININPVPTLVLDLSTLNSFLVVKNANDS